MKKNTASQVIGAQMVSATDGSAFTGAVTVYVTGDGGTQAAGSVGSGACTHEGNGYHTYAPAQAETNYDLIAFTFTGSGAVPATVQVFTDYPQTGDSYARLGAPAGASVSADIADLPTVAEFEARTLVAADYVVVGDTLAAVTTVGSVTGAVGSVTGAVGSVTGAVGSVTGSVGSIAAGGIAAAAFAAGAIDAAAIADNAIDAGALAADAITAAKLAADVTTELQAGLATAAELAKVPKSDSNVSWNATALAAIQQEATDALNAYDPPTNAELEARTLVAASYFDPAADTVANVTTVGSVTALADGAITAAAIATDAIDADALKADAVTEIQTGLALEATAQSILTDTGTTLPATLTTIEGKLDTIDDFLDTEVAAILADTNELQTDWTDGGRLDLILDAAGGAADPLLNAVPGAYAAGTAGYIIGSLTAGVVTTVASPVDGSTITATIAASLAATVTGLTISADWTAVYLTVKSSASLTDANSMLQVVVSNPAAAATDGALYVQKAAATAAQRILASLTVTQATGTIALALDEVLTGVFKQDSALVYDLKEITASGAANVLCLGNWNFQYTPTWAV